MTVDGMRQCLFKAYDNSPSWVDRVKRMPDKQVMAIYFKMKESGQLKPKKKAKNEPKQFTIFDYI